jgi:hypothetical protein
VGRGGEDAGSGGAQKGFCQRSDSLFPEGKPAGGGSEHTVTDLYSEEAAAAVWLPTGEITENIGKTRQKRNNSRFFD